MMAAEKRAKDRRIQKTQKLLREALGSLIREKPYDEIVVKEILDRANVGRSTFYMHFRDKDELLASAIHDLLRSAYTSTTHISGKSDAPIIRFSLPVFEHIHRHRHMQPARIGVKGWAVLHQHLQKVLAQLIADDINRNAHGQRKTNSRVPPDLFVQHVAATFIL